MIDSETLIILHDYFESAEGGGRLCLVLADAMNADLVYGFKARLHPFFCSDSYRVRQKYGLNAYSRFPVWKQLRLIRSFSRKTDFLKNYQTALYSGSYSICAAQNHVEGQNIYYCHTPPRFMYDQKDAFMLRAGFLGRLVLKKFIRYYRPIYETALHRMNQILTNSQNVKNRIKNFLNVDSKVVYPPCDIEKFRFLGQQDYYLSTARLDPLKNVERIVRAFLAMPDKNLVVISGGAEAQKIRKLASNATNIKVLGWVNEKTLIELIGHCIATIYIPEDEDFGMSPVESMAAGKPVLGVREGGLLETVVHEGTGFLVPPKPDVEDIMGGVRFLTPPKALSLRYNCIENAKRFEQKKFLAKMQKFISESCSI